MKRVLVIGTTGSGKTTMARKVAEIIDGTALDIDDFLWQPGWVQRPKEEMLAMLVEPLSQERWTLSGNNRKNRDFYWSRADTVIWLNYSFWVVFSRLLMRTIKRVVMKEEVMPGCVETFHSQFLSKDSLLVWFFKTYWHRKKDYRKAINEDKYQHLTVLEFRHPRQAKQFLENLRETAETR